LPLLAFSAPAVTYEPSGMDKSFPDVGEPAQCRQPPPTPKSPPDVDRLTKIGAKYGLEIPASSR
jgi:hypothetical protein